MRIMKPSEEKSGGGLNIESVLVNVPYTGWTENASLARYEYYIDLTQVFNNIGDNDIVIAKNSYDASTLDPNTWESYKDLVSFIIFDDTRKKLKNHVILGSSVNPSGLGNSVFTIRLLLFRQS